MNTAIFKKIRAVSKVTAILERHEINYFWGLYNMELMLILDLRNYHTSNVFKNEIECIVDSENIEVGRSDEFEVNEKGELRLIELNWTKIN